MSKTMKKIFTNIFSSRGNKHLSLLLISKFYQKWFLKFQILKIPSRYLMDYCFPNGPLEVWKKRTRLLISFLKVVAFNYN